MMFCLDLVTHDLPTIRASDQDQGFVVLMSDHDAQQLVDWLNTMIGLKYDDPALAKDTNDQN